MCNEVDIMLGKNPSRLTESTELVEGRDDEYFLRAVICPIYQVLIKVSMMCSTFSNVVWNLFCCVFKCCLKLVSVFVEKGSNEKQQRQGKSLQLEKL